LRAAPLGTFTEQTGTLAVEVGDQVEVDDEGESTLVRPAEVGAAALTERLAAAGLAAVVDGKAVLIAMSDQRPYDLVRDTVVELGLPLVRIEHRRHRLEDLFRDAPDDDGRRVAPATAAPDPPVGTPS
jgi:ABC-2 type transport system ATP-binding protein